ncbi:hypothetical protein BAUCODRAFT_126171 [Baudoinia panamericana UAMH 10762]|uniref:Uncharacterized protein n=1 Tax=Baudoinia panamericana (strain UAMH 10762) TaxID=717646 RepID=M2MLB0_BAUPA|nr:uncharacterized protein BAUCODRAFT_126171 [Baudoinia panamericana UAMH 10762]EMC92168.1 hypothetical protein BAUCODRAFT_126171 [Baudoinia panamericana UAMH 10762]
MATRLTSKTAGNIPSRDEEDHLDYLARQKKARTVAPSPLLMWRPWTGIVGMMWTMARFCSWPS